MTVKAYVLINTDTRETKKVLKKVRASKAVETAEVVTGPYDIIATIEAKDMNILGELITEEIHGIKGVEQTLSCIILM